MIWLPSVEVLHWPHTTSRIPSCKQQTPPLAEADLWIVIQRKNLLKSNPQSHQKGQRIGRESREKPRRTGQRGLWTKSSLKNHLMRITLLVLNRTLQPHVTVGTTLTISTATGLSAPLYLLLSSRFKAWEGVSDWQA